MMEYRIHSKYLFLNLGTALIDLVVKYGWDSVTILYENNDSMMRLKEIFTRTTKVIILRIKVFQLSFCVKLLENAGISTIQFCILTNSHQV